MQMNNQEIVAVNYTDENGNPAGGSVTGRGIRIVWQEGPLGRGEERQEPNGAFVETVIRGAKQRLEYYQDSKFNCMENQIAIEHLTDALAILAERTAKREEKGVEGTHNN
jgi:hypothetical protein